MSKIIQTEVFTYAELSDDAKRKALEWVGQWYPDFGWHESIYDDAESIGLKISSVDRGNKITGKLECGAEQCARKIMRKHGTGCETFKTAENFLVKFNNIPHDDDWTCLDDDAKANLESDFERDLLSDYLQMLRKEYEYQSSREFLEEMLIANEYTFTADGRRF